MKDFTTKKPTLRIGKIGLFGSEKAETLAVNERVQQRKVNSE